MLLSPVAFLQDLSEAFANTAVTTISASHFDDNELN